MTEVSKKILKIVVRLIFLVLFFAVIYYFRAPIVDWSRPYSQRFWTNLYYQISRLTPSCQQPLTFSIGSIDPRFGLSENRVIELVEQAGAIWSQAIDRDLFAYATNSGEIKINFVYDYRQETTNKLKDLGIVVGASRQDYEELKIKYDTLDRQYRVQREELRKLIADFEKEQNAYNTEVAKWNQQGGAPKEVYNRLNQSKLLLDRQLAVINNKTKQVNSLAENLNTTGEGLNQLIDKLNLNVDRYNSVGEAVGKEFQEGVYIQDETGRRIEVYEFSDEEQLIRLLAHELGHALGLDHSSGVDDIMYYLNEAGNDKLTANDLTALQNLCGIDATK